MKKILWSMLLGVSFMSLPGCGGPPPEEPEAEVPQAEIEENEAMGEVPTE
ncbi:MAG: hypothetical protein KDB14_27435 [Planctomycetales bacterium]|nr:hypothetical protein [Planctomycetales bacterium]